MQNFFMYEPILMKFSGWIALPQKAISLHGCHWRIPHRIPGIQHRLPKFPKTRLPGTLIAGKPSTLQGNDRESKV